MLLDAYQAAGALPVDVEALGVDICVGGSVKYLCGGPGAGWLYMRPEVAERLRPAAVGWFGHARPFGFEFGPIEYAEGIARFTGGTPQRAVRVRGARPATGRCSPPASTGSASGRSG